LTKGEESGKGKGKKKKLLDQVWEKSDYTKKVRKTPMAIHFRGRPEGKRGERRSFTFHSSGAMRECITSRKDDWPDAWALGRDREGGATLKRVALLVPSWGGH